MKKYIILVLIVLLISALFVGVLAAPVDKTKKVAHLYLYEKTPLLPETDPEPWPEVPGGAWGKMKYNPAGETFDFVFNGHGLVPGEEYCLIYIVDVPPEWSEAPVIFCFGMGKANGGGEVHIAGSANVGEGLPRDGDRNEGAKIWLILAKDCAAEDGTWGNWAWEAGCWNPTQYLFEGELITFDYTGD